MCSFRPYAFFSNLLRRHYVFVGVHKLHFTHTTSFYHTVVLHNLTSQWSELLQHIPQIKVSLEDSDELIVQGMTVKAYDLSMSANNASDVSSKYKFSCAREYRVLQVQSSPYHYLLLLEEYGL